MIELADVHKSFDGVEILKGINAKLLTGKTNLIIGQSGSGKTVLMKSLIGLHRIDQGKILFDGRNITEMTFKQLRMLRREMGMLFQGSALFDYMSVLENVMYPLQMFTDKSDEEIIERARFCLNRVNLPERSFALHPSEISGGIGEISELIVSACV